MGCEPPPPPCSQDLHPDPKPFSYRTEILGTTVTPEGETCNIEEVIHYTDLNCSSGFNRVNDWHNNCSYCIGDHFDRFSVMKRIVCPSGRNTTTLELSNDRDK